MAKSKNKLKYEPPGPESLCGLSRGDIIYCFRFPDHILSMGSIQFFHENTEEGPAFTFMCESTGAYRLALISSIIENPTKQQKAKINNVIVRRIKKENQKKK